MIILNDKPGQLCNRLWAFSFFIAYAQKHSINIYIPHFREYQQYFENISGLQNVFFNVVKRPKVFDSLTYQVYRGFSKILRFFSRFIDLRVLNIFIDHRRWNREQWQLSLLKRKNTLIYLGSWFHKKDVSALIEYKQKILMLFEPAACYRERVDKIITEIGTQYDIIIGVHIRRIDYDGFHDGIYYFNDDVYFKYMDMLQHLFPNKKVCFYLSSDMPIRKSAYQRYKTVSIENPAMVEDLYALTQCNYMIGPPSTFSMWASFAGDVPLRILLYQDENITLEQFSPILYQNVFKNGEQFHHIDNHGETLLHERSLEGNININV